MSFGAKTGELSKYKVERDLNFFQFVGRNLTLGLGFEGLARYFELVKSSPFGPGEGKDFLSLKKLDYFQIIPGAQAAKVDATVSKDTGSSTSTCTGDSCDSSSSVDAVMAPNTLAGENSPPASNDTIPNGSPGAFAWATDQYEGLKGRVNDLGATKAFTGYVTDNQEWLAVTSSVIGVYSLFNYMTANRIKNGYVRNIVSMATGVGVTCLGSYALGYQLDVTLVSDIGLRVMGYHQLVQTFARPTYWSLGQCAKITSILAKPMAFPTKQVKAN